MKVVVKLYALLDRYLPPGAADNRAMLELPDGATPSQVIHSLGLPTQYCHLVLVNGSFVAPGERATLALQEGDHLAIWPPVAGG